MKKIHNWPGVEYGSTEYHRLWNALDPEKRRRQARESYRRGKTRDPGRATRLVTEYRARHPEKTRVHQMTQQAVKAGRLKKEPCVICGALAGAHHDDYSQPLWVIWLCQVHHSERHKEMKQGISKNLPVTVGVESDGARRRKRGAKFLSEVKQYRDQGMLAKEIAPILEVTPSIISHAFYTINHNLLPESQKDPNKQLG